MNTEKPSVEIEDKSKTSENQPKNLVEREVGGFENRPEPTRYGDWDVNGRCSDF